MLLFDSETLRRLRHATQAARHAGGGLLARPPAAISAGGTELGGHRDYAPGDDLRRVDWNVCARHDELVVKPYPGDAECPVCILLDCSRSMSLGAEQGWWPERQNACATRFARGPSSVFRKLPSPACGRRAGREGIGVSPDNSMSPHAEPFSNKRARGAFATTSKFDAARRIVLALAYAALAGGERVSLLGFSDRLVARFGPIGDGTRLLCLARFLEALAPEYAGTDLAAAAKAFVHLHPQRGLAVVVSDLYDRNGFERGLEVLRTSRHHLRVVQILDPREGDPGLPGDVELVDVETGAFWQVTLTERHLARYHLLREKFLASVRSYCAGRRVACAQVPADLPESRLMLAGLGVTK